MSMLSAQIDELRERAKELRNLAPDPAVPYLVPSTKETMALSMWSAASEMEYAADTIWQLRDDLQRTNAEYAKLRELVRELYEMAYPEYPSAFDAAFAGRMRELGIEVGE